MSLVLALLTSFGYGVSDYLAGRVARRIDPGLLVLCSQAAQVGVVVVLTAGRPVARVDLSWGLATGLVNAIGFVLYYQALAQGPAVLVAPIVAASPAVPVAVAAALGDPLGPLAYLGLLVAVMGVVTTVSSERRCAGHSAITLPRRDPSTWESPATLLATLPLCGAGSFGDGALRFCTRHPRCREQTASGRSSLGHGWPAGRCVTAAHHATLGHKTSGARAGAGRRPPDRGDWRQ
jgi:drug/metabolite transporter (DMT)-like permease